MTGRPGPRIGYLSSLAARESGESLRPPHRLFGPVFTEPPTAATLDLGGQVTPPDHRQAAENTWPADPGGRRLAPGSTAVSGRRAPDRAGRPLAGPAVSDALLSAGLSAGSAPAAADAAAPRRDPLSPPARGASPAGRRTAGPPQAPGPVAPPRHQHDPADPPHGPVGPPHGPVGPPHGPVGPPHGAAAGARLVAAAEALLTTAGQQGPAEHPGTGQPRVRAGQPHLSPPAPASAMTGRQSPATGWGPEPAAGLSIGTIEVTVLPQPAPAPQRPAARSAAVRPSRTQPPRLTRGYGRGFGQGQG